MRKLFFLLITLLVFTLGWGLREGFYLAQELSISGFFEPASGSEQEQNTDQESSSGEQSELDPERPDAEQSNSEQSGLNEPGSEDPNPGSAEPNSEQPKQPGISNSGQSAPKQPAKSQPEQSNNAQHVITDPDAKGWLLLVNKQNALASDYVPKNLVIPDIPFPFSGTHEKMYLQAEVAESLERMFKQAKAENIVLYGLSGYRSYATQKSIFAYNVQRFGSEAKANTISAKPGQSEHQTGLAMDISAKSVNFELVESFADTPEGKWVKENAHKFGFIIRYPKGKEDITGYVYEPWHLRYVEVGPATEMYNQGITLEEYLNKI